MVTGKGGREAKATYISLIDVRFQKSMFHYSTVFIVGLRWQCEKNGRNCLYVFVILNPISGLQIAGVSINTIFVGVFVAMRFLMMMDGLLKRTKVRF